MNLTSKYGYIVYTPIWMYEYEYKYIQCVPMLWYDLLNSKQRTISAIRAYHIILTTMLLKNIRTSEYFMIHISLHKLFWKYWNIKMECCAFLNFTLMRFMSVCKIVIWSYSKRLARFRLFVALWALAATVLGLRGLSPTPRFLRANVKSFTLTIKSLRFWPYC